MDRTHLATKLLNYAVLGAVATTGLAVTLTARLALGIRNRLQAR